MIFAKIKNADGETESNIYESYESFIEEVSMPGIEITMTMPFEIRGKTYDERKESARNLAIDFQYENDGETDYQLSYYELSLVYDFFNKIGKRYGLLEEFRANAIC